MGKKDLKGRKEEKTSLSKIRTSYGIDVISGKVGNAVFSNEQDGVGMRSYNPISKQPFSPAQVSIESNFTKANRTWTTLAPNVVQTWRDFAKTQKVKNPLTGKYRTRGAKDVFVGLYAKLLQVSASSAVPTVPTGAYGGDLITITLSTGIGQLVATASAANSASTTTEFLVQKLASANAQVNPEGYHTYAFKKFASGALTQNIVGTAGTYAVAYRFVNTVTGQMTALVPLSTLSISLSVEDGGMAEEEARLAA